MLVNEVENYVRSEVAAKKTAMRCRTVRTTKQTVLKEVSKMGIKNQKNSRKQRVCRTNIVEERTKQRDARKLNIVGAK